MASKRKNSLVNNINRRKRAGKSRPKSRSTVAKDAYEQMQQGWPRSAKKASKKRGKKAGKTAGKKKATRSGSAGKQATRKTSGGKRKSAKKK